MKSDKNQSAGVIDKETNTDAAFEIGLKVSEAARLLKPYTNFRRFGSFFDVTRESVNVQHTIPTVVINGPLFSAHFDREHRKVVIEPAKVLRMHWNHCHHAVIYIVQRDAWPAFLEQIGAVQDAYFHETTSIISDPKFPDFIMDVSRDRTSTDQLFAKVSST